MHTHAHLCTDRGGQRSGQWRAGIPRGMVQHLGQHLGPHSPAYWALLCFLEGPRIKDGGRGVAQSHSGCSFSGINTARLLCPLKASMSEQERTPTPTHHQLLWDKFPPEDSHGLSPVLVHFLETALPPWPETCFFQCLQPSCLVHPCISKLTCCWHIVGTNGIKEQDFPSCNLACRMPDRI